MAKEQQIEESLVIGGNCTFCGKDAIYVAAMKDGGVTLCCYDDMGLYYTCHFKKIERVTHIKTGQLITREFFDGDGRRQKASEPRIF